MNPQPLIRLIGTRLVRARPLLLGRGAHPWQLLGHIGGMPRSPGLLGHDGGAARLSWHLGRDGRAARLYWLLGQVDGMSRLCQFLGGIKMARLRWLPRCTLPSIEREGS